MAYAPLRTANFSPLLVTLGITGLLAGCGHAEQTKPGHRTTPADTPKTTPAVTYDLSRVDGIRGDFPPGFAVQANPAREMSQPDIDYPWVAALTQAHIAPPDCRSVVVPLTADPPAGTQAADVKGSGSQGNIHVAAVRSPKAVPVGQLPTGCDMEILVSGAPDVAGSVDHVRAPHIDGVPTSALKFNPEERNPEYIFTATLDEQTSVIVMGSTDKALDPEQLMSDLLTKATAAVRGG
ncbi:MAG TPA: DUF5642 family protein [Mycobacterium sp.]